MKQSTLKAVGRDLSAASLVRDTSLLRQSVRWHLLLATTALMASMSAMLQLPPLNEPVAALISTLMVCALWGSLCICLWRGLHLHPHDRFGPANLITLYRAAGAALLVGWIPGADLLSTLESWVLALSAVVLLALDGVDGYLARRTGLGSAFGARFDMEVDAMLTMILCVLLWRSGETGVWILTLGGARYAFLFAALHIPALEAELYPSFRRKLICVVQIASLCALMSPLIDAPLSGVIGGITCVLLLGSFARDIHWLLINERSPSQV